MEGRETSLEEVMKNDGITVMALARHKDKMRICSHPN